MKPHKMQLLTIITEPVLLEKLHGDLKYLGATGLTVAEVSGEGTRQANSSEIPGEKVKVEAIVNQELAEKILAHIAATYFQNFSTIAYSLEVMVVRPEKFQCL